MDEFEIDGVIVKKVSVLGYAIDSVYKDGSGFVENSTLKEMASKLLKEDEFKGSIIFYDGCLSYNIKTE